MPTLNPDSQARTERMHLMARDLLNHRGMVTGESHRQHSYYLHLTAPDSTLMKVWVKCAYRPENGGSAAMLTFPKDRPQTDEEAVGFVEGIAHRRIQDVGATHILLLVADPDGYAPTGAYLLPLIALSEYARGGLATEGGYRMWNGAAFDLWVVANPGTKVESVVEVLRGMALDLLREPPVWTPSLDAINDLDEPHFGNLTPQSHERTSRVFQRDWKVRQQVLERAKGRCEYCHTDGFLMSNGQNYLEAHHIIALADDGEDTLRNVIALCPTHHREAHYGVQAVALEAQFIARLMTLVP